MSYSSKKDEPTKGTPGTGPMKLRGGNDYSSQPWFAVFASFATNSKEQPTRASLTGPTRGNLTGRTEGTNA